LQRYEIGKVSIDAELMEDGKYDPERYNDPRRKLTDKPINARHE
jgi:hypothetical protein